ncbi:MFS transporter [Aureimonas sp. AU40]|uniref:MFS transporter n=1 Tax=Aureimonas sp. AU40 TaxID=1637747 RepID=UPI0007855D53|nr:MFS transporter [Aureimonas sp. AU40]
MIVPSPPSRRAGREAALILLFLFGLALANASLVTFMGFHIVHDLGQPPWAIGLYAGVTTLVSVTANRAAGERIDGGWPIARLVSLANFCTLAGTLILALPHDYARLLTLAAPLVALGQTATTSLYSLGRLHAERNGIDPARANTRLRTMTSLGWMIGPALCLGLGFLCLPRDFRKDTPTPANSSAAAREDGPNPALRIAGLVCLLFSISQCLCAVSLPIFLIQDIGLPTFAPGLSFAVKCLFEVVLILSCAPLIARFGARTCLVASAGLGILAYALLSQVHSLPTLIVGAAAEGIYCGLFAGVSASFVQGFSRGRIGRATSLYMNSLFLGSLAATSLLAALATFLSFRATILAAMGTMAGAALLLLLTRRFDAQSDLAASGRA